MLKKELTLGYCPVGNGNAINPFDAIFKKKKNVLEGMDGVDAVVFWGGTDVHPSYYKQHPHLYSQAGHEPSDRDKFEWSLLKYCKAKKIPVIGVCRGAQLFSIFAGGRLIQHCDGHGRDHTIETIDGRKMITTSAHHQMMYPWEVSHTLLAWSDPGRSSYYEDANGKVNDMWSKKEPEIVYFPEFNGLAIQGHPEWADPKSPFALYCNELVTEYLLTKETENVE